MANSEFIRKLQWQLEVATNEEQRARQDAREAIEVHQRLLEKRQQLQELIKNYR